MRVDAFKTRIFGKPDVILHRREIMDRDGVFAILKNDGIHEEFNAQFANLIEYLHGPAFTVSIEKAHSNVWQFDPF